MTCAAVLTSVAVVFMVGSFFDDSRRDARAVI